MRRRASMTLGILALVAAMAATLVPVAAASSRPVPSKAAPFDGRAWLRTHGYLPLRGVATLRRAKAHAAAEVAAMGYQPSTSQPSAGGPKIGANWQGVVQGSVTPPDANGAIGPKSYIETVNQIVGIYKRDGTLVTQGAFSVLTGHGNGSDPMILWDPDTDRFYFNIWDTANATMDWGFSKSNNPTSIPGSFCSYETSFGYPTSSAPDYPKLGQSKNFLMIGVNWYKTFQDQAATSGDLLWVDKPQGSDPITTCPSSTKFKTGIFKDLRNQDGGQGFTPTPAIQTDPSSKAYVSTMTDIECPPICGKGTVITEFTVSPSKTDPKTPILGKPRSVTVGSYKSPPDAPQKGSSTKIDTLDGRLTHAVSGKDPKVGATTVWVAHAVLGGAGSMINWYEIKPTAQSSKLIQTGSVKDSSLYVYDAGISNDRTVSESGQRAHGDSMVLGFTTSSANAFPADQMVDKVPGQNQSAFVLVKQSNNADTNFGCSQLGYCRWGDYGGATPDPAADLTAAHGEVWLSQQWTTGQDQTYNWEAKI
jgi:hypothetical protein